MKKMIAIFLALLAMSCLAACEKECDHDYDPATCQEPKTCSECGDTKGKPTAHNFQLVTCEAPKVCADCGEEDVLPAGHDWKDATCAATQTCTVCAVTQGEPLPHNFPGVSCQFENICPDCGAEAGTSTVHVPDQANKCVYCQMVMASGQHTDLVLQDYHRLLAQSPAALAGNAYIAEYTNTDDHKCVLVVIDYTLNSTNKTMLVLHDLTANSIMYDPVDTYQALSQLSSSKKSYCLELKAQVETQAATAKSGAIAVTAEFFAYDLENDPQLPTLPKAATPEGNIPYLVKLFASEPIYALPDYSCNFVQYIGELGTYTVIGEYVDSQGNLWGKMKSGLGWVMLTPAG